jgi:hypothetical protein
VPVQDALERAGRVLTTLRARNPRLHPYGAHVTTRLNAMGDTTPTGPKPV